MKNFYSKTTSLFLVFCLLCTACNNQKSTNEVTNSKSSKKILNETACNFECMQSLANDYENILGTNILIFETLDDAYEYVDNLSDMNYSEFETEYATWGFTNTIASSLLAWKEIEDNNYLGDDFSEDDLNSYITAISQLPEETKRSFEEYIEDLAMTVTTIEPRGNYNLNMLYNPNGFFIAENKVYFEIPEYNASGFLPIERIEDFFDIFDANEEVNLNELLDRFEQLNNEEEDPFGLKLNNNYQPTSDNSWWYNYGFRATSTINGTIYEIITVINPAYNQFWFFGPWTQRCFNVSVFNNIIAHGVKIPTKLNILADISFTVNDSEGDNYEATINFAKSNKTQYTYRYHYNSVGGKEKFYSGTDLSMLVTNGKAIVTR